MYWLDILNGPGRGRRRIQRRSTLVGSALTCQLWLEGDGVATRHLELVDRGGDVMVRPVGPARVAVNGQPIAEARLLNDGDTITVGSIRIRYRARLSVIERWGPVLRVAVPLILSISAGSWAAWQWWKHRAGVPPAAPATDAPPYLPPADVPAVEPGTLAKMDRIGAAAIAVAEGPAEPLPAATVEPPMGAEVAPTTVPAPPQESVRAVPTPPDAPSAVGATTGVAEAAISVAPPPTPPSTASTPAPPSTNQPAIAATPPAKPTEPAPTPPRSPASPFATDIDAAEALAHGGDIVGAARRVAAVPESDTLYPRALAIRARAAEAEGRVRDAERMWTDILKQTGGTPLYETAFQELIRLAEIQVAMAPPPLLDLAARTSTAAPPTRPKPPALPKPIVSRPPAVAEERAATTAAPPAVAAVSRPPVSEPALPPRHPTAPLVSPAVTGSVVSAKPYPPLGIPGPAAPSAPSAPVQPAATSTPPVIAAAPPLDIRRPSPPPPSAVFLRADAIRFPTDADNDDLRVVTVDIRLDGGIGAYAAERLTFDVAFFDRVGGTMAIVPSRVAHGSGRFRAGSGLWQSGETRSLSFPYSVPRGAREAEQKKYGAAGAYHGFRIRMFADGKLIGEHAKPADLLSLP